MIGLLFKDIIVLKKQMKIILLFLVFYGFLAISEKNISMFIFMTLMFGVFLPTTSIAFDDRSEWNKYALCMSIKRSSLATSKYVLGLSGIFTGLLCSLAVDIYINHSLSKDSLLLILGLGCIGILIISLYIPVTLKVGIERSRFIITGMIAIPTIIGFVLSKNNLLPDIKTISVHLIIALAALVTLLVFIISLIISIHIMNKKEY